ncbi:MAG: hypothetical protein JRN34_00860 [Nitrososphaerota archaeon]|jgi:intergrase/recombinase|nr:hypothetical protein [Nitrososphaerota archaeon]MDG6941463.1 hypothetical protein [Nitrososphaerota archaeon]
MRSPGFEPGLPAWRANGRFDIPSNGITPLPYGEYAERFHTWLWNKHGKRHAYAMVYNAKRYFPPFIEDQFKLKELLDNAKPGKRSLALAIRNLLNYIEEFSVISEEDLHRYRKVVKVPKTGTDDYVPVTSEVVEAYKRFSHPEYKLCFKVMLYSGIRPIEAVEFLRIYDRGRLMVEGSVAKYPLSMDRGTKRVLYCYLPTGFVEELRQCSLKLNTVKVYFSRHGLPAKYLRKWQYNFLIENNVPESVCDFVQGRSLGKSVGGMHYLTKVKQADRFYSRTVCMFPVLDSDGNRETCQLVA